MGKSLGKAKIIEFNGLPGSGKTTLAKLLINKLRSEDFIVYEYSDFYSKHKKDKKVLFKLPFFIRFIHIYYLYCCFKLLFFKRNININDLKIVFDSFLHFLLLNYCYNKHKHCDYIILDQGITQNFLSILYDTNLKHTKYVERFNSKLEKKFDKYYMINTHIDVTTTLNRIAHRKTGTSRLDRIEFNNASRIAHIQMDNFAILREVQNNESLEIDTIKDIEENVHKIREFTY